LKEVHKATRIGSRITTEVEVLISKGFRNLGIT
jgi:hypothetical protein